MKERYITIKVKADDHRKLKVRAAEKGISMMELFSEAIDKISPSEYDLKGKTHKTAQAK